MYQNLQPPPQGSPMGMAPGQAGARQRPRRSMQHGGGGTINVPNATPTIPNEANQSAGKSPPATGTPATAGAKGGGQQQQGGPFQMQNWYGGNPLQTAQDRATRALQTQLGGLRAQFGGMGLGNSSRSAIAQGTALGEFGTGLGDVLAQRGQQAYASDADRALMANQQLANMGTGLTGIGSTEQNPPLASVFMNLLNALTGQNLTSSFRQSGGGGYWT